MKPKHRIIAVFCVWIFGISALLFGDDIKDQLRAETVSIQNNIDKALGELETFQKSQGANPESLDAVMRNLASQLRLFTNSLKRAEPDAGEAFNEMKAMVNSLLEQLKAAGSSRNRSDWKGTQREFLNMKRSAQGLYNMALELPSKDSPSQNRQPVDSKRVRTKNDPRSMPAPAPPVDPVDPDKPANLSKASRAISTQPDRGIGPNDPRAAPAPAPPVDPVGPDDQKKRTSAIQERSVSNLSKTSPTIVRSKTAIPRMPRTVLSSGLNLYFSSSSTVEARDRSSSQEYDISSIPTRPLSLTQLSEAIASVRETYNMVPLSYEEMTTTPFITMSPAQVRAIREGSLSNYDYYRLNKGTHYPYANMRTFGGEIETQNWDVIYCDNDSSFVRFRLDRLDTSKLYLADIAIGGGAGSGSQFKIGDDIVHSSNGHILYAFSTSYERVELWLRCLGRSDAIFKGIDIYKID